jgi:hypothetical protein
VSWLAFMASLVHSLAWPTAVAVGVVVLRQPIGVALGRGVHRLRAGPFEVEFDQELTAVRAELSGVAEDAKTGGVGLVGELSRLVQVSPRVAILEAFTRVEIRLAEVLQEGSPGTWLAPGLGLMMAHTAHAHGLISDESLGAVQGLAVLRDLVVHAPEIDPGAQRARDYIALADATLATLGRKPDGR